MGINNFGLGGVNGHILLNSNPKIKINDGEPIDNLPRLLVCSGRTEEAVNEILNDVNFDDPILSRDQSHHSH